MKAYPMPMFVKLQVHDMKGALAWYHQVLGFASIFELPGHDGRIVMAHIRGKKYQDLMLVAAQQEEKRSEIAGSGVVMNFMVEDMDAYVERAQSAQADIVEGPVDRPWNARELVLQDLDGYQITLSMNIHKNMSFDEVIDQVIDE